MSKLFIVGFPRNIEEITLVELFSVHGTVESVTIITDKETGISKGYGFVTMTDERGAERAIIELDGTTMGERQISVRLADDKKSVEPTKLNNQKSTASSRPAKKKRPRL